MPTSIPYSIGDKLRLMNTGDETYTVRQIIIDERGIVLYLSMRGQHALTIRMNDVKNLFERVKK
jgi:hypothetical protein